MMQQYRSNSYLFGGNAPYVEEMYEAYLDNPGSVPDNWRDYFDALQHVPAVDGTEARDVAHRHGSRKDRRGAMQQDPVRRTLFGDGGDSAGRSKRKPSPPVPDPQQRLPFLTEDLAAEVAQDTPSENS